MTLPRLTKAQMITTVSVLLALSFLIFGRTIDYPFVRFDDGLLIYDNPAIQAINLKTLRAIFSTYDPELYIPLTLLTYQLDFLIGGINPAIYHLHNILWHAMNGVLVTWLLYWLLRIRDQSQIEHQQILPAGRQAQIIALILGAIFVIHPLNVETVAWASARKDLLSTFFALGSILAYLQWHASGCKRLFYVSLALFWLGLMSKVTIITLPLIFVLLDHWSGQRVDKKRTLEKMPYFALSIAFAVIALFGKAGQISSVTPMETILVGSKAAMCTLQKIFLPIGLSVLYPYNEAVTIASTALWMPLVGFLCLLGFLSILAIKRRPIPLLCFAFFLIALSPSLFNFSKGGTIYITSDRYGYFAMVGILLGIGSLLLNGIRRDPRPGGRLYRKRLPEVITVIVIAIFMTLSIRQTKTWASSEALFTNAINQYPDAHVAHNNLGNVLTERKSLPEAIAAYERALAIAEALPHREGATDPVTSKILSNLASTLRQSGETASSKRRYDEALERNPANPYAYLGLGIIAATEGRLGDAEGQYQIALQIAPKFSPAYLNLGALYSSSGRLQEALGAFDHGLAIDPFAPQTHYNRGVVLQKQSRMAEARAAYATAIELAPSFVAARINLGILEANRGHREEAVVQFREVLRYDPDNAKAADALRQLRE